jgi:hypothetical protein
MYRIATSLTCVKKAAREVFVKLTHCRNIYGDKDFAVAIFVDNLEKYIKRIWNVTTVSRQI